MPSSPKATQALPAEFATAGTGPAIPADRFADLTSPRARDDDTRRTRLSNDQIAERLFLSPLTVKTHINRAMMKLAAATALNSSCSPTRAASSGPGDRVD